MSRAPFRLPASRRRAAADVERELALHLELKEADLVRAGLAPDVARAEARRQFGELAAIEAECVAIEGERQRGVQWRERLAAVAQDARDAVRTLRRNPGFTATAALTLGIGLGATVAMLGIVDAVLLRRLPLPGADRIVAVAPHVGESEQGGSPALRAAFGERSRTLQAVGATYARHLTVVERGQAERVPGAAVDGAYFRVLGETPLVGRALQPADDAPGAAPVVVLGERLWRRAFGADRAALGRTTLVDGRARTIVGVMPDALDAVSGASDLWVPLALAASQRENFTPYLSLVGRLAPGATTASAGRELDAIVRALGAPATEDGVVPRVVVTRLDTYLLADVRAPLLLLLAAVAAVQLIGCVNVSTLMLARSVTRARELALRASLGAGQGRLARQLVAEHLALGMLATAVAVPVAALGVRALVALVPVDVPRLHDAGLDLRALAAAIALGLATSLGCALLPALDQRRLDVRTVLQGGVRAGSDPRGARWRRLLVGAEVALALVLLVGSALLLRSAAALAAVRPGFDLAHTLTARVALPARDYPELPRTVRTFDGILDATRRLPGVASAALVSRVPLGGSLTGIDVARTDVPFTRETKVGAALRIASPDYFRTMGIPLLGGRDLAARDDARSTPVVVVNATLARRLAGGGPVIGRLLRSDNAAFPRPLEIVGVVGDVRDGGLRADPDPEMYVPMGQVDDEPWTYWIGREMLLVARTPGEPGALAPALRRAVASVDARLPLYDVQSTGERVRHALALERLQTWLLTLLGALGLALAAVGIHGVVAYAVGRRTREVGVRLALGATPGQAVTLVTRESMRPVVTGIAVGLALAVAAARTATRFLFGVSPFDPVALGAAALLLGGVALVACWLPARRMARVDPVTSLRAE